METADLILRFAAVAQLALLIAALGREVRAHPAAAYGCLFLLGLAGYLLCPLLGGRWNLGVVALPVFLLCFSVAPLFWLFSRAWFEDDFRLTWSVGLLVLLPAALGVWHRYLAAPLLGEADLASLLAHKFLSLGFALAAVVQARLGRRADLLERRRRLRDAFVVLTSAYIVVVVAFEIYGIGRAPLSALGLVNVGAILVLLTAASALILRADGLFPDRRKPPVPAPETLGEADRALLGRLTRWIEEQQGYRESGLTVSTLAAQLETQEHRLRRLINQTLGFRNFNEFLNHYRLAEARERLANPDQARIPVLTIALDLGYGSLSPFNRAFKETSGATPVEYRRQALSRAGGKS